MQKLLSQDPSLASWISSVIGRLATVPSRDRMNYDTMEAFLNERLRDIFMTLVLYPALSLRG